MGLDILKPQISYAPAFKDLKARNLMLKSWENRLPNIFTEEPIFFFSVKGYEPVDGDPVVGMVLKKEEQNSGKRTAGQNLGYSIPSIVYKDVTETETAINGQSE